MIAKWAREIVDEVFDGPSERTIFLSEDKEDIEAVVRPHFVESVKECREAFLERADPNEDEGVLRDNLRAELVKQMFQMVE
jgi:hypothetical protein